MHCECSSWLFAHNEEIQSETHWSIDLKGRSLQAIEGHSPKTFVLARHVPESREGFNPSFLTKSLDLAQSVSRNLAQIWLDLVHCIYLRNTKEEGKIIVIYCKAIDLNIWQAKRGMSDLSVNSNNGNPFRPICHIDQSFTGTYVCTYTGQASQVSRFFSANGMH